MTSFVLRVILPKVYEPLGAAGGGVAGRGRDLMRIRVTSATPFLHHHNPFYGGDGRGRRV